MATDKQPSVNWSETSDIIKNSDPYQYLAGNPFYLDGIALAKTSVDGHPEYGFADKHFLANEIQKMQEIDASLPVIDVLPRGAIDQIRNSLQTHARMCLVNGPAVTDEERRNTAVLGPMFHGIDAAGTSRLISMDTHSREQKRLGFVKIAALCRWLRMTSLFFVSESWVVKSSPDELEELKQAGGESIKDHEDSFDVITMGYYERNFVGTIMYPIVRDSRGEFEKLKTPPEVNWQELPENKLGRLDKVEERFGVTVATFCSSLVGLRDSQRQEWFRTIAPKGHSDVRYLK